MELHYNGITLRCVRYQLNNQLFSVIESDELVGPGNDEIKDNQWLGVTVRSQGVGGKVMVHLITWNFISLHFLLYI